MGGLGPFGLGRAGSVLLGSWLLLGPADCGTPGTGTAFRQAEGILEHFPQDVQSEQSWLGHPFLVSGVPVHPTKEVPEPALMHHVGKRVRVSGPWDPGQKNQPDPMESMPLSALDQVQVRGEGIRVQQITKVGNGNGTD